MPGGGDWACWPDFAGVFDDEVDELGVGLLDAPAEQLKLELLQVRHSLVPQRVEQR